MEPIRIKRVYEAPAPDDGFRVLVDRIWPRGITKATAAVDLWMKEVAPSTDLRQWFGHHPARWEEFLRRYHGELGARQDLLAELQAYAAKGRLTLVYSAHDAAHNQAVALKEALEEKA